MNGNAAAQERARVAAGLSQWRLADRADFSQSTLRRVVDDSCIVKMPELIAIAEETGDTRDQFTKESVARWLEVADDSSVNAMRARLVDFPHLSTYLDERAIIDRCGVLAR